MDTFSHSQASDWEALCTALILTSLLLLHNDDDDDDDAGRDRDVNDARNANFGDPALVWHVLWDPTKMREKVDNDRAENQDDDHRVHRPGDHPLVLSSVWLLCKYEKSVIRKSAQDLDLQCQEQTGL